MIKMIVVALAGFSLGAAGARRESAKTPGQLSVTKDGTAGLPSRASSSTDAHTCGSSARVPMHVSPIPTTLCPTSSTRTM